MSPWSNKCFNCHLLKLVVHEPSQFDSSPQARHFQPSKVDEMFKSLQCGVGLHSGPLQHIFELMPVCNTETAPSRGCLGGEFTKIIQIQKYFWFKISTLLYHVNDCSSCKAKLIRWQRILYCFFVKKEKKKNKNTLKFTSLSGVFFCFFIWTWPDEVPFGITCFILTSCLIFWPRLRPLSLILCSKSYQ